VKVLWNTLGCLNMCMDIIFQKQQMYRIILQVHLVIRMQLLK